MPTAEQLTLPFASLDFPGRTTISMGEIAARIGCSVDHLYNEAELGALCGLDIRGKLASRRSIRVPIEAYRTYVLTRMTGTFRSSFIRELPAHVKRDLRREMISASDKSELREMITEIKAALVA